jgi:transcription-repair coupling factor (superfamily II helicase)
MILPLVSELLSRIGRQPSVDKSIEAVRYGPGVSRLAGLSDPAKAIVTALTAARLPRPVVLIVESNERAESCLEAVRYFYRAISGKPDRRVVVLPAYDVLPYEQRSPHPQISEVRGAALWRFASGEADILIAPIAAAQMRLFDSSFYGSLARVVERDQDIAHSELLGYLHSVGYETRETVEMPGQLTVRGGIVDLFSPEALRPVRLEFFGDSLESIREFDADTQRSTRPLERTTILPLTDTPRQLDWLEQLATPQEEGSRRQHDSIPAFYPGWEFNRKIFGARRSSLLELRPDALMIEDEPESLQEADAQNRSRVAEGFEELGDAENLAPPSHYFLNAEEWDILCELYPRMEIEHLAVEREGQPSASLLTQPTTRFHGNVSAFMSEVRTRLQAGENVIASASTIGEIERLADICHEYEVPYRLGEFEDSPTGARLAADSTAGGVPALVLLRAPLDEGVAIPDVKFTLFGTSDLFETFSAAPRNRSRPKTASFFTDISDLRPGDHVVHVDHGIGRFDGLRQIAVDGTNGEFMLLSYADEAKIYLPLARLDLVQKYQSLGGPPPVLDRLGSAVWEARKARVRKSVDDMAEKLLALYADRKTAGGHAFPADSEWQREFEDAFEFDETPDQAKAIADVKRDLESDLPMDRLLCGDVGYGKTEVAMRAAFKALADGKQVAMLAPTTVLAFQHYQTFRSRFAAFPMRIDMLSRFRSSAEQQKTIEALAAGQVDVIIGTHRLLSKDVIFHDLGLLVVDEEQRFGVSHKERLKEIRKNVDVLTMSATPIPRTLHMSLVGLRDMSVIETPPKDRIAIQTSVAPFQEGLIQRAIEAELARQGQVFFVHNRVESITSLAALVNKLVPKARVVIGHGQMKEAELERVMMKFIRHEADVLVSTTIIENGLDIPRANTILINRADRMGLAELYQLRGRVGRSDQRAYAYLLVPPEGNLTTIAKQRLVALKEFSELGAGFRIAALDLELRGAGNILGRQQHGHIEAVGFDLYCRMMERAVAERKGEAVRPERRTTLNLGQDVRIPKEYIETENLRLRIYKRIADIAKDSDYDEVRKELEDRFGPLPASVGNLLDYALLKAAAERLLVASIDRRGDQLAIKFHEDTPVKPEKLVSVIRRRPGLRLDPSGVLWVSWKGEAAGVAVAARNVLLDLEA